MELDKAIDRIQMHIDIDKATIDDDLEDEYSKFVKEDIDAFETILDVLEEYKSIILGMSKCIITDDAV